MKEPQWLYIVDCSYGNEGLLLCAATQQFWDYW